MRTIKAMLMARDGMMDTEADDLIEEAKEAMQEYLAEGDMESAHDICAEFFGLEPDYLMELID